MIRGTIQPMVSNELVDAAAPVACFVCDAVNTRDAEHCRRCGGPMALAHQATGLAARPKTIAVLGPSGSGKTVYLGMLMDILSRQQQRLQIIARGAFSIGLQQTTVSALARCEFPAKTGADPECWNWMHCEIIEPGRGERDPAAARRGGGTARRGRGDSDHPARLELVMPDMAGEAILEEVEHAHSYFVVRSLLRNSAAAIILVDAAELAAGNRDADFAAMKILSCMRELEVNGQPPTMARRPVAVVFTKVDQVAGCRERPEEFARAHASGTWQHCRQEFREHGFFAASVVGCCAWLETRGEGRRHVPLRVEPYGIVEPFEWLLDRLYLPRRD